MRGRASGFYLGVLGVVLVCAAAAGAFFVTLYVFDQGYVAPGQTNLAYAAAVVLGIVFALPGLGLIWMADMVNEMAALRRAIAIQTQTAEKTSAALMDVAGALDGLAMADAPARTSRELAPLDVYDEVDMAPAPLRDERHPPPAPYRNGHSSFDDPRHDWQPSTEDERRGWSDDDDDFERI